MTQRREIEGALTLYEDLSGILGAMRSFALAELHRVMKREASQQQVITALTRTMQDAAVFLPPQASADHDIWLLFGSVRGFCGSFNEDVLRSWRMANTSKQPSIVVGERLFALLQDEVGVVPVSGADSALDAATVIDRILFEFDKMQKIVGNPSGLVVCLRDEKGARVQRLLPLPTIEFEINMPPLVNAPAAEVATGVAEHYLFHSILSLQLLSIRVENHMRLMQMENALQHLERGGDDLKRQRNRLRQEEIVEEIELMARKRIFKQ